MKRLACFLVAVSILASVASAAERFSQSLSPAEFKAAGLDQLTPDQLARLDEFARAYQVQTLPPTTKPASQQNAAQKQIAPGNSTPAQADSSGVRYGTRAAKPAAPAIETSRIVGTIAGWNADTVFRLENGEVWTVANGDRYSGPEMTNPAVQIRPASVFGGFWMRIESLPEVRVRFVSSAGAQPEK